MKLAQSHRLGEIPVNQHVEGIFDYLPKRVVDKELLSLAIYNGCMWHCSDQAKLHNGSNNIWVRHIKSCYLYLISWDL